MQNSILERLVGDADNGNGSSAPVGDLKLQWANLPESWGVFVLLAILAAVVFAVFWMYRREINTCPRPVKMLLAGLRLAVLLLLIAMYLKPSVFYQQVNELKPTISVLRDASLSLARGDAYRDAKTPTNLSQLSGLPNLGIADGTITRGAILDAVIERHPEVVRAMRKKGTVRVRDFADGSRQRALLAPIGKQEQEQAGNEGVADTQADRNEENEAGSADAPDNAPGNVDVFPPLLADGLGTNITRALREELEDSTRISSIVLMSEGQHNGDESPVDLAEKAGELGIPIYTIGIGDPNPPRNLSVNEVYVRSTAYPDEPFEIESVLQTSRRDATGLPPQVVVTLGQQRIDDATGTPGERSVVKTKSVDVPTDGGRIRVDFDHVNNVPGKYLYTVEVEQLPNETDAQDNALTSSQLEVVDEQVKVLLISGLPNWDYQQVQRLLQRDPTVSLTCWLQSMDQSRTQEGNAPISRLPRSMEELGQYNVIIMMDPDPSEFDASWMDLLKNFCKYKAGGLLFMAGPQFSSEFLTLNRLEGMRDLLPVKLGNNEFIDSTQAIASASAGDIGSMVVVPHNLDHPVMSFKTDPQDSQQVWSLMPTVPWSFPVQAARPTARVLIERGDQISAEGNPPLMVSGRYGAGSVMFMGFQGTWRWRPLGLQAQYFDRFWIQVIRFLVETRSLQGSRRGFLDREKSEYELGERVALVARVLDSSFQPMTQPELTAVLTSDDGRTETVSMQLLPQQQGRYEGTFEARRLGNYSAVIDLGPSEETLIDPVTFRVVTPSAETGSYWLNEPLLREIAEKSGGQYLRLDELEQLPELLPTKTTRAEFNSPSKPLWDASDLLRWMAFLLPVMLLSIEWAVRKYYKLL